MSSCKPVPARSGRRVQRAIQASINHSSAAIANKNGGGVSKKPKRHAVGVGDLVRVASPMSHAYGQVGVVKDVLDKKRVIVESIAPGDDDYTGMEFVAYTAKPTGTTTSGSPRHFYRPYIRSVLSPAARQQPKKVKAVIPPVVVETQQQLIEHLASPSTKPVLIKIPAPAEPASPAETEEAVL